MKLLILVLALLTITSGCATQPTYHDRALAAAAMPDTITAQVTAQSGMLESCRKLYADPRLNGTLLLRFRVHDDGTTSLPHIYESIGQSAALDRCLIDSASKMRFEPMPSGVVADVEYPMHFNGARRQPATADSNRKP